MTDPLTHVVGLIQPKAVLMSEIEGVGDWGIRFPHFGVTNFAIVAEGGCWLQLGGAEPQRFETGDFLLQPEAGAFAFLSGPRSDAVFGDAAFKAAAGSHIRLGGETGLRTRIVGGYLAVDRINTDLFSALLPRAVHVKAGDVQARRIANLLDLIADEAGAALPGRALVVQRLAEVLLVEALRRPLASGAAPVAGVLAGLNDRQLAAALQVLHADVGRAWTLLELARAAGMSRSAFARRFQDTLHVSPMQYLARWRVALAKRALIEERLSLDELAERIGYGSAGALSHAFLRLTGCTPSAFRDREKSR